MVSFLGAGMASLLNMYANLAPGFSSWGPLVKKNNILKKK